MLMSIDRIVAEGEVKGIVKGPEEAHLNCNAGRNSYTVVVPPSTAEMVKGYERFRAHFELKEGVMELQRLEAIKAGGKRYRTLKL
jgi:hypothetical protein